jgi:predicted CXXCH cytochrome family protein
MPPRAQLHFKILSSVLSLFLALGPLAFTASAARKSLCLKCHKNFDAHAKKIRRSLKIGCDACHIQEQGRKHPRNRNSIRLKSDLPALCYNCHEESKFKNKDVHTPVAEGMCTACHDVHRSRLKSLLNAKLPGLCFKCHDRARFTKKYTHKVALNSCGRRCHNPHSSEKPYLLSQAINDYCTGCHMREAAGTHAMSLPGGQIHPVSGVADPTNPKKEMSCTSCHNPHSSNFVKLFYSGKKCKRCHKFY